MKKVLVIFILFIGLSFDSVGQTDTLFWFVAPDVSSNSNRYDEPIFLMFSTMSEESDVIVDMPADLSFSPINITISPNSTKSIDLSQHLNRLENSPPDKVLNKGIRIRATKSISAYYDVESTICNCNPEIFTLKGQKAIGTKFYCPFQDVFKNGGPFSYTPVPKSTIDIVATEDNTTINITPTKDIIGHNAGTTFSIKLNKGQTYSATAKSILASEHLGGTKVTSDKPIAITLMDDLIGYNSCADLAGDQLIPIDYIGNEYIVVKLFLDAPDYYYILAIQDNTEVYANGNLIKTLSEGEQYAYRLSAGSAYINSNNDIYILHISGIGCEMSESILPPLGCTGSKQIGFVRSSSTNFNILLIVENGGESNFILNNRSDYIKANSFSDVPSTNGAWKYAVIPFNTSQVPVGSASLITNSSNRFHMGITNGFGGIGFNYGYFSDYGRSGTKVGAAKTRLCVGETLRLLGDSEDPNDAHWTGPDGFTSNSLNPIISNIDLNKQGYYVFKTNSPICGAKIDSVYIQITEVPVKPEITSNSPICVGGKIKLEVKNKPNNSFKTLWYDKDDNLIKSGDSIIIINSSASDSGVYIAKYRNEIAPYCLSDTAMLTYSFFSKPPKPNLHSQTVNICEDDSIIIVCSNNLNSNLKLFWSGPNGFESNENKIEFSNAKPSQSGFYKLFFETPDGCRGDVDSININVFTYPDISKISVSSNSPICAGETLVVSAKSTEDFIYFEWNSDNNFYSNQSSFEIKNTIKSQSGLYRLTVSKDICTIKDSIFIDVDIKPTPIADFVTNKYPFAEVGDTIIFTNQSIDAETYKWDFGDLSPFSYLLNPKHIYHNEDNFTITLTAYNTDSTCNDSVSKSIDIYNKEEAVYIPSAFSPNDDGTNDLFEIYTTGVQSGIKIQIFNRWGEKLFETNDAKNEFWDGTYMGSPCKSDIYMYYVNYKDRFGDNKETKGTITLLR